MLTKKKEKNVAKNRRTSKSVQETKTIKDSINEIITKRLRFKALNESQKEFTKTILDNQITIGYGPAGTGKSMASIFKALELIQLKNNNYNKIVIIKPVVEAEENLGYLPGPQPLTAKILTPDGWVKMGDIKVGDFVIGRDGKPTKVIGIYPQGEKVVYKITTTNGGVTHCSGDHIWSTKTYSEKKHNKPFVNRTTLELMETLYNPNSGPKLNHYLPFNDIVEFNDNTKLPITPYVMGVILGDGSISNNISISSNDIEIINRVKYEINEYGLKLIKIGDTNNYNIRGDYYNNKIGRQVKITTNGESIIYETIGVALKHMNIKRSTLHYRCENKIKLNGVKYEFLDNQTRWRNYIKNVIYELGLEGTKAKTKFIPNEYKYTTLENRINLLQGLMDSDGTIKKNTGEQSYTTISKQLAYDVIEIARSLGLNASFYIRDRIGKSNVINGKKIISRDISYEVNIPKHEWIKIFHIKRKRDRIKNTGIKKTWNKIKNIEYFGVEEVQCIEIENPEHLYITDDYIITHNSVHEKLEPYVESSLALIDKIIGKKQRVALEELDVIEIKALAFLRGINIDNTVLVMEEAQNMSKNQMKTLLTRIGTDTKFIISGDLDQSDRYNDITKSGLYDVKSKLTDINDVGIHEFETKDIVRNPLISKILSRYKNNDAQSITAMTRTIPDVPKKERVQLNEGRSTKKEKKKEKVKNDFFSKYFKW